MYLIKKSDHINIKLGAYDIKYSCDTSVVLGSIINTNKRAYTIPLYIETEYQFFLVLIRRNHS